MKNIWKGLIGFGTLLLGLALWIAGSIFEGFAGGLAGESFLLTRGAMGVGFFLIVFGPVFFWIILPLKDRWYESHPKKFIAIITPFVLFLLLIFGVVISGIIHEPQLPTYSFNTTIEGDKIVVDINRITEGDLPDRLSIKLIDPDGEQIDFDFVSNSDLKDGQERVELNLAHFGASKIGNFTLIIQNIRDEIVYQKEIEVKLPKYSFRISAVDDEVHLTIKRTEEGSISDTLKVALDEKDGTFSWWDSQEVEVTGEKTSILKPRYRIGGFSKEYLVKVKNVNGDIIFNETVVLKPKNVKLGDSIVVNNIKITPISATYVEETEHSGYWSRTKAKEGYTFLVIEFKGKNVGNYKSSAYDEALLKTTKGYFYDPTTYLSFSLQPEEEDIDYLTFEIPKDQRGVELYFEIGEEERILQL